MPIRFLGYELQNPFKRALTPYNDDNPKKGLRRMLGWWGDPIGRTPVTEFTALSLSPFWAGVRAVSEKVAEFPVEVLQTSEGRTTKIDHPTLAALTGRANRYANYFDYCQILISSAIIHGNGFAIISRNGRKLDELLNVHPASVTIRDYDGELYYEVEMGDDMDDLLVSSADMIHLKGFGMDPRCGISIIEQHRYTLGLSLAARDYGTDVFNKGTRIDGIIKYPGKLDKATKDAIADQWTANYGPNGKRGIAIIDGDVDYTPISMLKPQDAQFLETRGFQASEIAAILGVPPYLVGDASKVSYNNMEMYNNAFYQSLLGWIRKIVQEYNAKLLFDGEKASTSYKLNANSLLRADVAARGQFYEVMSRIGAMSPNEVRAAEGQNPYEGGDEFFIEINKIPVGMSAGYYSKENDGSKDN